MPDRIDNGKTEDAKDKAAEEVKVKIPIDAEQVLKPKRRAKRSKRKRAPRTGTNSKVARASRRAVGNTAFPKHPISACLRIPKAMLEKNAGKESNYKAAANYAGLATTGSVGVEISSALKYGLLEKPDTGMIRPTELLRRIVRPQNPQ